MNIKIVSKDLTATEAIKDYIGKNDNQNKIWNYGSIIILLFKWSAHFRNELNE